MTTFDLKAKDLATRLLAHLREERELPVTCWWLEKHDAPGSFLIERYYYSSEPLLCESNLAFVIEALEGLRGYSDHTLRITDKRGRITPAARRLAELFNQLDNYPVLDDDDYSDRQCEFASEHGLEYFGEDVFAEWRAGGLTECSGWVGDPDAVPAPDVQPEAICWQDLEGDALAFVSGHAQSRCLESDCCY